MQMTWKEFQKWCNDRAADGCWGYKECKVCVEALRLIQSAPFWKRNYLWKLIATTVVEQIVLPTNQKIAEIRRINTAAVRSALDELCQSDNSKKDCSEDA